MFGRKNSQRHVSSDVLNDGDAATLFTVVGSDARLDGTFEVADSIHIECEVGGRLKVGKRLVIGKGGSVRADVEAVDVIIHGEYEGNMVATGSAEITPTGRVVGNIETNALVICKGGFFNGHVARLRELKTEGSPRPVSFVQLNQLPRLEHRTVRVDPASRDEYVPELIAPKDVNGSATRESV